MKQRFYRLLVSPLPQDEQRGFDAYITSSSYNLMLSAGIVVILFEAFMILSTVIRSLSRGASLLQNIHFFLYIALFVVACACVGTLFFRKSWYMAKPRRFVLASLAYAFFNSYWACVLSAYSHRNNADITVFMYVCLALALIVVMKPWQSILLFLSSFGLLNLLAAQFAPPSLNLYSSRINSGIVTVLAVLISMIRYHAMASDYHNQTTILRKNQHIQSMNNQLQKLVMTDVLTGSYNRRYWDEVIPHLLQSAWDKQEQVSLLMLDIDFFKEYNDIYGHVAGDACLKTVAECIHGVLAGQCPAQNPFVRYGGEEFMILLRGAAAAKAVQTAQHIRNAVQQLAIIHQAGQGGILTVSVGVYMADGAQAMPLQEMVRCADSAMYCAKSTGRNTVCLYQEQTGKVI